jgi:succinate-semialdehyde dehydrogenase / glutarate-semialdehyde dehydrogenase
MARMRSPHGSARPADWAEAEIGPMINARAVDKIERHVNDAVTKGAKVVVGGQ